MRAFALSNAPSVGQFCLDEYPPRRRMLDFLKRERWTIAITLAVFALAGGIELAMGRLPLGPDGKFGWWEGDIWSSENSQRFADPYSFSHLGHGILFYAFLWLV